MEYIEWVHHVMHGLISAWRSADDHKRMVGLDIHDVVSALGFDDDTHAPDFEATSLAQAVRDALRDLDAIGWVEAGSWRQFKVTPNGASFIEADAPRAWRAVFEQHVEDEAVEFLTGLCRIGEERFDSFCCVREVDSVEVFAVLGWEPERLLRAAYLAKQLASCGMAIQRGGLSQVTVVPTYVGFVRGTKKVTTELAELVAGLAGEWETTNVEFKRELNLNSDREKARLVSRVIGLANTKTSGRRFLVVGFDDATHEFVQPVDPAITVDRLEQIVHAYSEPPINLAFDRVDLGSGEAGLIEVVRRPEDLPYSVNNGLGGTKGIRAGDVYVRHGRRTEKPTVGELEDLVEEGRRARSGSAPLGRD